MSDTPETDKEMRDVWLKADDSCVETWAEKNGDTIDVVDADFARRLERQRDAAVALNYAKAEIIDELADILNMPTGATDEEIGEAASEAIRQRDAYAETLRQIATSAVCGGIVRERHPELTSGSGEGSSD